MAKRQVINGNFQDALGNPLVLGYLTWQLTTDAKATDVTEFDILQEDAFPILQETGGSNFILLEDQSGAGTLFVQIVAGRIVKTPLDSSGNIDGTVSFWPNDQLTPSGTKYKIKAYKATAQLVWQTELSLPSGTGSYSLT